eukprot:COSAG01_NODE_177_length_22954_cov_28.699554_15_plen_102_part_00
MIDPDKTADAAHNAAHAFLYSEAGLDDPPKNAEHRLTFFPNLKTRHEGDTVTSGEQVMLLFGGQSTGDKYTLNTMNTSKNNMKEVNAVLPDDDIPAGCTGM